MKNYEATGKTYEEALENGLQALGATISDVDISVLEEGSKRGFNLDSWSEHFDFDAWMAVFEECGLDPTFYANRRRPYDEVLPWDHLDYGVTKQFLINENEKAKRGETTGNCREKCAGCGLCVAKCPNHLISIVPKAEKAVITCSNHEKGAVVRKECQNGCIGCMKCSKINDLIKVENNISYIPADIDAIRFGEELAHNCPTGAIVYKENIGE